MSASFATLRTAARQALCPRDFPGKELDGIIDSVDMRLGRLWQLVMGREAWHAVVYGVATENLLENQIMGDFPSSPVAQTLCSQYRGHGFDPWSGN